MTSWLSKIRSVPRTFFSGKTARRGQSLLEILAILAIVATLGYLAMNALNDVRRASRTAECLVHLRQIHQAVILYRAENQAFPLVPEGGTLRDVLQPLLGNVGNLFHCPEDTSGQDDSYTYFYVPRTPFTEADRYLLGCSRHQNDSRGVAVYAGNFTEISKNAPIIHDDGRRSAAILPGTERDVGTFRFADGSTVTIATGRSSHASTSMASQDDDEGHAPAHPVIGVMFSFRDKSGRYSSMVRMKDGQLGTVNFNITPGHRFEVATPAAIIAVRGTRFSVTTTRANNKPATQVEVTSGEVDVDPVSKGRSIRLTPAPGQNRGFVVQGDSPVYN